MDENISSNNDISTLLNQLMQNPDVINNLLNSLSQNTSQTSSQNSSQSQNNTENNSQNTFQNPFQSQNNAGNIDLSSILNNINPEMLNSLFSSLGQKSESEQNKNSDSFDPSMLFNIFNEKNNFSSQQPDNITCLLLALKPFVNQKRQDGIDVLCKLLKYLQIAKLFGFDITKILKL